MIIKVLPSHHLSFALYNTAKMFCFFSFLNKGAHRRSQGHHYNTQSCSVRFSMKSNLFKLAPCDCIQGEGCMYGTTMSLDFSADAPLS